MNMRRSVVFACCAVLVAGTAVNATWGRSGNKKPGDVTAPSVPDPKNFSDSAQVDNRWLPYTPGTQFVFTGSSSDGKKRLIFTVVDLVKEVGGVQNIVIWDRDYTDGELVEAELAFFAQDDAGNVWHTGEYPEEYENGKVVKTPVWIAGVKGAKAGIEMRVDPRVGTASYAQGYAPPPVSWNDRALVVRMGERTCVPSACYENVLVTREFNVDEPGMSQLKYYAPGVGNIRVGWAGKKNQDREALQLTRIVRLDARALAGARAAALKLERRAYRTSKSVYGRTPPAVRMR